MTTNAELNADFDRLARLVLKVKRDRDELMQACRASYSALQSYRHGNASPDLAGEVCALIEATIDRAEKSV